MDVAPIEIHYYQTASGRRPFADWLHALDQRDQIIVDTRLARVRRGLFGDFKSVGGGVFELRLDVGPGRRIYCARSGGAVVILLCAGDKKSQAADIRTARAFWKDYLRRTGR